MVFLCRVQLNKNIKIFLNYFLGPLLFAWLLFSIYIQIVHRDNLEASWLRIRASFGSSHVLYLFGAMALIPVNWGLETLKWQLSVRSIHRLSFLEAFKAVLSGVSFSVTMPNRVGEYIGRMAYLPEGHRLSTIPVTLVGSLAQLLITIIAGAMGLVFLKPALHRGFPEFSGWYLPALGSLLVLALLLLLLYFRLTGSFAFLRRGLPQKFIFLIEGLQAFHRSLLIRVLLISALRYLVFLVQYLLVFYLFDVDVPPATVFGVMALVFLVLAVVPSIALLEVGVRGEASIRLMGLFSANVLGIGFASITIWFLNLVLPALVGSLLLLNLRIFKKRHEPD